MVTLQVIDWLGNLIVSSRPKVRPEWGIAYLVGLQKLKVLRI